MVERERRQMRNEYCERRKQDIDNQIKKLGCHRDSARRPPLTTYRRLKGYFTH